MLLPWLTALLWLCPVEASGQETPLASPKPEEKERLERTLAVFRSKEAGRSECAAAMRKLVAMDSPGVRARILDEARRTSEEGTLYWTCSALVEMQEGEVVPVLIKRIQEPGGPASPRAVELLGRTGDRRAVQPLVKIIRSPARTSPRAEALVALGGLAGPQQIAVILGSLDHEDYYVRRAAGKALGEVASAPGAAGRVARLLADKIRKMEKGGKPALIRLFGKLDSRAARAEVSDYLRYTREYAILRAAVHAAGELKMADAAERLLEIANDNDQPRQMRELALRALGETGATEDLDELVPLLESDEAFVRKGAHRTLRRLTGKALPPSPDVWSSAVILAEEERAAGGPIEFDPKELPATPEPQSAADVALAGPPTDPLYYMLGAAAIAAAVCLLALRASLVRRKALKIEAGRRKIRRRSS
ncbi:MAG: HEAT repeat domain-containing protein [Planctomycetota bacterium]|jgi:HEAT repeat protein